MSVIVLRGLAEASVRASVVAAIVALLLAALRVRASAVRHAAWAAVVAAMLAMPLLPSLVPAITVRNPQSAIRNWLALPLPALGSSDGTRGAPARIVDGARAEQAHALQSPAETANDRPRPSLSADDDRAPLSADRAQDSGPRETAASAPTVTSNRPIARQIVNGLALLDAIPSALLFLYLIGVAMFFGRAGLGWRAAHCLVQRADEIPDREIGLESVGGTRLAQRADEISGREIAHEAVGETRLAQPAAGSHSEVGGVRWALPMVRRARRPIAIRESADITTPMTMGVLAPMILLPRAWRDWSDETRRAVLAHEQAHVDRRDALVALLAQINRSIFWFHPLAWWLARTLASEAEHACDAAAVRAGSEPRRYAALLVEMARTVHDGGGRLAPSAIGLGGRGLLGRRIDRVLDGPPRNPSVATTIALAACAVITIAVVAACRFDAGRSRFTSSTAIEQRDRSLRRALRETDAREYKDFQQIDWDELPKQIAPLEATVAEHPDDLDATRQLLVAYWIRQSPDRRRAHILRLIARHPEAELTGALEARLFPYDPDPIFAGDAVGYEQAKAIWLAHLNRPDPTPALLGNASYFFETTDKPLAEALLVRARAREPNGPWTARLGRFYARTLIGARGPSAGSGNRVKSLRTIAASDIRSPYAISIRQKLGESTDEELLAAAGWFLSRGPRWLTIDFDPDLWAQACFERALRLNPQAVLAHSELLALAARRDIGRGPTLWELPPALQYQSVSALPEPERFARLPRLARNAYVSLADLSRWDDPNLRDRRALAEQQARQYAEDALTLAPKYRNHPQYGTAIYTANITLGALALRAGDRAAAVRFLMKASDAPASEELAYGGDAISGLRWNLAKDLVERGERDAVMVFLKKMAETSIAHRADLREAAAAISRGETPRL